MCSHSCCRSTESLASPPRQLKRSWWFEQKVSWNDCAQPGLSWYWFTQNISEFFSKNPWSLIELGCKGHSAWECLCMATCHSHNESRAWAGWSWWQLASATADVKGVWPPAPCMAKVRGLNWRVPVLELVATFVEKLCWHADDCWCVVSFSCNAQNHARWFILSCCCWPPHELVLF